VGASNSVYMFHFGGYQTPFHSGHSLSCVGSLGDALVCSAMVGSNVI